MSKQERTSKAGTHASKSQPPPVGPTNPASQAGRIWLELPPWAKAALREIAKADGRASTRQATIMLIDAIKGRITPGQLAEFQQKYAVPASTEASE